MKSIISFSIISLFLSFSLNAQTWDRSGLQVYEKYDALEPTFALENDTIHVINFWATWCKPCVAELPYFEALLEEKFDHPLKVTLISLDFKNQIDSKLIPFLNESKIKSKVVVLTDGKFNTFIDRVDESWEGSIPATLILHEKEKRFYERVFHDKTELQNIINTIN